MLRRYSFLLSSSSAPHRRSGTVTAWHPFEKRGLVKCSADGGLYVIDAMSFESVMPSAHRGLEGATVTFNVSTEPPLKRTKSILRSRMDEINSSNVFIRRRADPLEPFRLKKKDGEECEGSGDKSGGSASAKEEDGLFRGYTAGSAGPFAVDVQVDLATVKSTVYPADKASIIQGGIRPSIEVKDLRAVALFSTERVKIKGRDEAVDPPPTDGADKLFKWGNDSKAAFDAMRTTMTSKETAAGAAGNGTTSSSSSRNVKSAVFNSSGNQTESGDNPEKAAAAAGVNHEIVDPVIRSGYFLTWSSVYKTGLIVEADAVPTAEQVEQLTESEVRRNAHIVRGVSSFSSALPTSVKMYLRQVHFKRCVRPAEPRRRFAVDIVVVGNLSLQTPKPSFDVNKGTVKGGNKSSTSRQPRRPLEDETRLPSEPPTGRVFGVVVRWSGGQGAIETGEGYLYFIASSKEFEQLVQPDGQNIRGAVVTFAVDASSPKFAKSISILSLTSLQSADTGAPLVSAASVYPPSAKQADQQQETSSSSYSSPAVKIDSTSSPPEPSGSENIAANSRDAAAAAAVSQLSEQGDVRWVEGTIITWSPLENQALIQGDDGGRYVLQDAVANVVDYKSLKSRIRRGARVRLTPYGSSGRLAGNVVITEGLAPSEEVEKAELTNAGDESHSHSSVGQARAKAPPAQALHTSTEIWSKKMKEMGINTSEADKLRERNSKAVDPTAPLPPELHDPFEPIHKDQVLNDPKLNKKFYDSDMTYKDFWMRSPSATALRSLQMQTPEGMRAIDEQINKMYTEEQKEAAYRKSMEMGPTLMKMYQDARNTAKAETGGKIHFH